MNKKPGTPTTFVLRVYKNGKKVKRYDTGNYMRFLYYTRLIKWGKGTMAYIRVNYSPEKNWKGKTVTMFNDMDCISKADLSWAIKAFIKEYV